MCYSRRPNWGEENEKVRWSLEAEKRESTEINSRSMSLYAREEARCSISKERRVAKDTDLVVEHVPLPALSVLPVMGT